MTMISSRTWDLWDALKWVACCCTLAGALCTSLRLDPINIVLFNCGAALYLCWSVKIKEPNLIVINGGLLAIYIVGLFFNK